jgi:hypothetical protein
MKQGRFTMELKYVRENGAGLSTAEVEEMAKHGITCIQINQFLYGGFRYSNVLDAIAEAERHPGANA